jgi:hypothetical protein
MNKPSQSDLSAAMQRVSAPHGGKRAAPVTAAAEAAEKKKLTIYVNTAMHRGLRQLAVDRDSNINTIVVGLIEGELRGSARKRQPAEASP